MQVTRHQGYFRSGHRFDVRPQNNIDLSLFTTQADTGCRVCGENAIHDTAILSEDDIGAETGGNVATGV